MNIFVIALKGKPYLNTPVFHAGPGGKDEAIAVFTERKLAEKYLADANWTDQYEVGELPPIQALRWLTIAHEQGSDLIAINPDREAHLEGDRQRVVDLSELWDTFAETLHTKLFATAEAS